MKPYFEDKWVTIYHGDCREILPQLSDRCVNMILCDLPYGITARNKWDIIIPFDELWKSYNRIIKKSGIVALTAVEPFATLLSMSNIKQLKYDLVWVKNKKTGFLNANKMPLRQHERVLIFYKELPTYNPQKTTGYKPVHSFTKHTSDGDNYGKTKIGISGGGQTDRFPTSIISIPVHNNDAIDKFHPTQKPVALFEYLIKTYTNEYEVVLDNCLGVGTTAVACRKANRYCVGIEIEEKYCEIAANRCRQEVMELKL